MTTSNHPDSVGVLICTIRRHPDGGWTPVLHPASLPAPAPGPRALSLPDVPAATRHARNQYGTVHITVCDDRLAGQRPA